MGKRLIRSKAPLRLGLAGGGTDVSPYSDMFGGCILNATINLFAYCTIEETSDGKISITSFDSGVEKSYPAAANLEIDGDASLIKGVYNHIIREYGADGEGGKFEGCYMRRPEVTGFRITTYNDAPAGSGLGTSSTMVVSIVKCFSEWFNLPLGDYEIARMAYIIERKELGLAGGKQDQYAAAFGGFNFMEFHKDDTVTVNPLRVKDWIVAELESSMLLYFTGKSRSGDAIIRKQQKKTTAGDEIALNAMHRIKQSSIDMKLSILKGQFQNFANIIDKAWQDKKMMADEITNPIIQEAMDVAMKSGALAGKVSGAGGGGFIMLVVDPVKKKFVEKALSQLPGKILPFLFYDKGATSWKRYLK